eukprot:TRINITY_DN2302_c0_g1_i1.p1 TRINITY_DN2302_c0_g1~~TRINITY_DN2302_c0_g1_i1.p1  ORF type:complete len:334 (+),score=82.07 TRINITY_DN2302_c0_g1_i1:56-1057(+)
MTLVAALALLTMAATAAGDSISAECVPQNTTVQTLQEALQMQCVWVRVLVAPAGLLARRLQRSAVEWSMPDSGTVPPLPVDALAPVTNTLAFPPGAVARMAVRNQTGAVVLTQDQAMPSEAGTYELVVYEDGPLKTVLKKVSTASAESPAVVVTTTQYSFNGTVRVSLGALNLPHSPGGPDHRGDTELATHGRWHLQYFAGSVPASGIFWFHAEHGQQDHKERKAFVADGEVTVMVLSSKPTFVAQNAKYGFPEPATQEPEREEVGSSTITVLVILGLLALSAVVGAAVVYAQRRAALRKASFAAAPVVTPRGSVELRVEPHMASQNPPHAVV